MKDQNIVFALETERRANIYIHDRPAARALWARLSAEGDKTEAVCLVTGERGPIARLHPSIKGVWGAQSSGASIVSFNLDAFTSYGHEQGDNAPVSEAAAFAYTTALNRFLESDSGHRIQIGDASTVFWADASEANKAAEAENYFAGFWDDGGDDAARRQRGDRRRRRSRAKLEMIRAGPAAREGRAGAAEGVRFHVLGLAPNAARLSIRFYFEDDFGAIAANYQRFLADMRIEPPPRDGQPALWRYLVETAVLRKRENVPPNLAGEWLRAILTGTRYPQTLLSTVLMRLRADNDVNALRVAMLKAVLIRNCNRKDTPVSLKPDNRDKGYLLGRLFAVYERIQTDALGGKVNATIKDKFYGSASAQPRKVFALLDKGRPIISQDRQAVAGPKGQSRKAGRRDHGGDGPGRRSLPERLVRRRPGSVRPRLLPPAQRILQIHQERYARRGDRPMTAHRQSLRFRAAVRRHQRQSQRRPRRRQSCRASTRRRITASSPTSASSARSATMSNSPKPARTAATSTFRKARSSTRSTARPTRRCVRTTPRSTRTAKLNPKDDAEASAAHDVHVRQFLRRSHLRRGHEHRHQLRPGARPGADRLRPVDRADRAAGNLHHPHGRHQRSRKEAEGRGRRQHDRTENRTMGRKHIVPYGLYRAHGFVSAKLAERTGFGEADLELLFDALANMFEHDHSAARGEMASRKLIVFKHASALGNAPAHALFERVRVGRNVDGEFRDVG